MTDNETIWRAMQNNLPKKTWIPLAAIYDMVSERIPLDADDLCRHPMAIGTPYWKSNVLTLLRLKTEGGTVHSRRHQK